MKKIAILSTLLAFLVSTVPLYAATHAGLASKAKAVKSVKRVEKVPACNQEGQRVSAALQTQCNISVSCEVASNHMKRAVNILHNCQSKGNNPPATARAEAAPAARK